tara:strand:- start:1922 stop:3337 length:1416 start_codon:yes stop_codon:yes gene_type:complete
MYDMTAAQWSQDYNNFKTSTDRASEFISSDEFTDDPDEWLNLDKIAEKNGYDTKMEFVYAEQERIHGFLDNMKVGVEGGMKYGTKDKEVLRALNKYNKSLELSILTLGEDRRITPAEAQHIATGNIEYYQEDKKRALTEATTMIKEGMSDSDTYNRLLSWVDKKEISKAVTEAGNANFDITPYVTGVPEAPIDWDTLRADITSKKALNETEITQANQKYKDWAGRYFADATFGQETENELKQFDVLDLDKDGNVSEEEKVTEKKAILEEEEKQEKMAQAQKEQVFGSSSTALGEVQEYSPPRNNKQAQEVADALGEKSYSDVKDNYLAASPSTSFPTSWRASNVKKEDAKETLNNILSESNISTDDISNYLSESAGRDFENAFKKFVEEKGSKRDGRDILYNLSPKLYQEQKGVVSTVAGYGQPGGRVINKMIKIPSSKIKSLLSNYKTVDDYEGLALLYSFIGQELNKGK